MRSTAPRVAASPPAPREPSRAPSPLRERELQLAPTAFGAVTSAAADAARAAGAAGRLERVESAARASHGRPPACPRCRGWHAGLCAAAAPWGSATRRALGLVGLAAGAERQAETELRQRALTWVSGLVTASGRDRGLAVASCGRPIAGLQGESLVAVPYRCGDRFCPRCQALRSRDLADALRVHVGERLAAKKRILALHLTQRKPAGPDALQEALDGFLGAWRQLTNVRSPNSGPWHAAVAGALRSVEVTWSPKGTPRRHGGVVAYSGWHVHAHCLVELREEATDADLAALERQWLNVVGGSSRALVRKEIFSADDTAVTQVTKYVCKPLAVSMPVHLGRQLARTVHGRKLHLGVGQWRGWRAPATAAAHSSRPPTEPVYLAAAGTAPRARLIPVAELVRSYGGEADVTSLADPPRSLGAALVREHGVLFVSQRRQAPPLTRTRSLDACVLGSWRWLSEPSRGPPVVP